MSAQPESDVPASLARRNEAGVLGAFALGGATAGLLAKVADGPVTWLGDAATYLAVWVVAVVFIGALARSASQGALRAAIALTTMCMGYYGYASLALQHPIGREAVLWVCVAATVVPALAAVVQITRAADRLWSGVVIGAVAALCVADDALTRVVIALTEEMPETFLYSVRPVQAFINVLSAAAIVLLVPRSRRVRWAAMVVAIPFAIVSATVGVELRSLLGV